MQINKIYRVINPTLLYDEIKEFAQKRGLVMDQNKLVTYSLPNDSSSFIHRGTLTFKIQGQEALRVHMMGLDRAETRLILESDDVLFAPEKMKALEADLDFTLGAFLIQP